MMNKLWKWSMWFGGGLLAVCMALLLWYSANKSVVIVGEHDRLDRGNLEQLTETILEQKKEYGFTVIVNPAHGGSNTGNMVNDLAEKEITLRVGAFLEELSMEGVVGIFLIRKEDMDISNESREKLIEAVEPDMVLDLHVNADPGNERTFGTATIYNGDFYRRGMNNVRLADIMERELVTAVSGKANGIFPDEEDRYPLLKVVQVPIVSIEMGYLTNSTEAALLKREDYQRKLAQGLYNGILRVREEMTAS